jgi:hypothetical protein
MDRNEITQFILGIVRLIPITHRITQIIRLPQITSLYLLAYSPTKARDEDSYAPMDQAY